jgi:DNA primase
MNIAQNIKDRIDIAGIISAYVKLEKRGNKMLGLCPFHHEKTPSFSVSPDEGYYHCFGCKKSGDVFSFLMEMEKKDFPDVLEELAHRVGIEIPKQINNQNLRETNLTSVMLLAKNWFVENLNKLQYKPAKNYLVGRNFSEHTIAAFDLGFAPDGRSQLSDFLIKNNISRDDIIECGLAINDGSHKLIDRFKNRVMFPIYNERKHIVGFGGRLLDNGLPKYLNSPETPLFKKKEILFNLDKAKDEIRKSGQAYVVEGYIDVISLSQAGFINSVATLGTALTAEHLTKLWKYCSNPTICMDGDEAGKAALLRAAHLSIEYIAEGKSLDFVLLPSGLDPDEALRTKGDGFVREVLSQKISLSDLLWESELMKLVRRTPEDIALFEQNIINLANKIKNSSVKSYYLKFFKDKIWNEFKRIRLQTNRHPDLTSTQDMRRSLSSQMGRNDRAVLSLVINCPLLLNDQQIYQEFENVQFELANSELIRNHILMLAQEFGLQALSKQVILSDLKSKGIEFDVDKINFDTNFAAYVIMWNIMLKQHMANKIELEYRDLVLRQDEASFNRAQILREEVLKLKDEIVKLQSEFEDEQLQ